MRLRLADIHDELMAAQCHVLRLEDVMPEHLYDGGRAGDEDLAVYQMRRVVLDRVLARALSEAEVTLVEDRARGLVIKPGLASDRGVPRVAGVDLRDGGRLECDVVVDAAGRRSPVAGWLRAAGLVGDETAMPCGVRYYSRHYEVSAGDRPRLTDPLATATVYPTLDMLWFPCDGDTAVLAVAVHDQDPALKALRHGGALDAVARENPDVAPWLEISEPTTEVFPMGTVTSRLRRPTREGAPVVVGVHHVGDALCATNPTKGRGIGMTLAAVGVLTDLLLEQHLDNSAVTRGMDAWVAQSLTPYFLEAATWDAEHGRRKRAALEGRLLPQTAPTVLLPDGAAVTPQAVERASWLDPEVARAMVRAQWVMDGERRIGSPEITERVERALREADPPQAPPPPPTTGLHDRMRVLELVAPWLG